MGRVGDRPAQTPKPNSSSSWANQRIIEAALSAWTTGHDPDDLTRRLQAAGVAARTVQHSAEIVADPQLIHRDTPVQVAHPRYRSGLGREQPDSVVTDPARSTVLGAPVGHHTHEVLGAILGSDDDTIADLVIAGAIA